MFLEFLYVTIFVSYFLMIDGLFYVAAGLLLHEFDETHAVLL